jgi:uncharacterized protein (TIGR00369 family)
MARIVSNVPPGYNMLPELNGYAAHSGPYFWSKDADGGLIYGFQSDERHGNPNGVLHGGAIVTFVDTALGHTVLTATGRRCTTVALDNQFVTAIPSGSWIDARVRVRKLSKTLAFLDAEATSAETLLLAATAIFRMF